MRCCKAPLFNTLRNPRLAFVGVAAARLSDAAPLGPVIAHAFIAKPDGGYRHTVFNRAGLRIVETMLLANLSGHWRKNPFFDNTGAPIVPPQVLPKDARFARSRSHTHKRDSQSGRAVIHLFERAGGSDGAVRSYGFRLVGDPTFVADEGAR